ncbi:hypothetical protein [Nocardia cyriacigeorgica]|uniref:hypothetical protein n=1 Tax=Nocardia cyriacigeorgica TaxID=135487 RepID=UPI0018940845|nr:hypothetical protein [Nocardia cyriacigeorgica]MBF6416938.1 hypothetical protein [Nocardia cyriacigeorgica]
MSRGQLPRRPWYFPRMKDRGARRRARHSFELLSEFAEAMHGRSYSYGGFIPPTKPIRVGIAVDECVLVPARGWACARTDPAHRAAAHPTNPGTPS